MFNKNTIKDVLSLALPAVGEMTLYMMIWVFDTMMVGKYGGRVAVSAVGLSSEILYTFINIFISVGISVGITSLVSRRFGAKQYDSAEEYASVGFFIGIIISLFISIIMFVFSKHILTLAQAKDDVINLGVTYMRIISFGLFFNMLTSMFNGIVRGYGNTKTPLLISALINVVNLSLDWILIFGRFGFPELGVKGAAIATSTAQITGFIFAIIYMLRKSKIKIRIKYIKSLNKNKLKQLLKLAIPSSMQEGAFSISRLLNTFMIMHIGATAFAANQITTTIESVSFMPGWGFGVAATTLVGHKIGEKNYKKAKEYAFTCTFLGALFMALCALFFLVCPEFLIKLFITNTEKEVIRIGILCLMVASVEQIPMGISLILGGALKGSGDTKTPFKVSFVSSWLIRLPLMFYFIYVLKVSVVYVWWVTAIQWIFEGVTMFILFKRKFKHIKESI
ncbi:MATE family efflux transporter [Clostridium ganghwense]|uniref:Probable multidrug resistance protein NorM n=2 Tax=Clostridium ganghwense TaxID=312089 RepID=A0ABT4CM46_9CLOT|nr:MATE family efflux transporter [Clostridium ganghwense]MCY6370130.1 MATE family efflux transporter [Clostridium ganghwense]